MHSDESNTCLSLIALITDLSHIIRADVFLYWNLVAIIVSFIHKRVEQIRRRVRVVRGY